MRTFRHLAALLLALCMLLGLAACELDSGDARQAADIAADILAELEAGDIPAQEPEAVSPAAEADTPEDTVAPADAEDDAPALDPDGSYTSKEDVALYLHTYGELPRNFITKSEARELGWPGGGLEDYAPGKCIGGDRFGNYEGILPEGSYHECDIDTLGASSRGAKRIVYSDDGYIYYTEDHYESFELLYP